MALLSSTSLRSICRNFLHQSQTRFFYSQPCLSLAEGKVRSSEPSSSQLPKQSSDRKEISKDYITINNVEDISCITGVPDEHIKERRVLIKVPTKNSMQSGTNNLHQWTISFDTRERWENGLMGWTSTADPLSNMEVNFANKEEAILFCEKNGWPWELQQPASKTPRAKSYAANFSWNKRTRRSAK